MSHAFSLPPTQPTETCIEPFQATLIDDCHDLTSINPYWADQVAIILVATQNFAETVFLHLRVNMFFCFYIWQPLGPFFTLLRLELFLHFWLKEFLQLRVIFTYDADVFTFVIDFYIINFFTFVVVTGPLDMKRMDYFLLALFGKPYQKDLISIRLTTVQNCKIL